MEVLAAWAPLCPSVTAAWSRRSDSANGEGLNLLLRQGPVRVYCGALDGTWLGYRWAWRSHRPFSSQPPPHLVPAVTAHEEPGVRCQLVGRGPSQAPTRRAGWAGPPAGVPGVLHLWSLWSPSSQVREQRPRGELAELLLRSQHRLRLFSAWPSQPWATAMVGFE